MSTTAGVKTVAAAGTTDQSVTWQMWVPCLAMAACSWLSFFHRTMFAALAPTILKETMSGYELVRLVECTSVLGSHDLTPAMIPS